MAKALFKDTFDSCKFKLALKQGKTADNPHKIAASFSQLPELEPRPHVEIQVEKHKCTFWALLDTGASISLVSKKAIVYLLQEIQLTLQESNLFVQDCHSNVNVTDGCVTVTFNIKKSKINSTEVHNARAVFHITENLSSDFLFGCDVLKTLGCKIDFVEEKVTFHHKEASAFLNAKHPLLVSAAAASVTSNVDKELANYVAKYTYAASPVSDVTINPNDQRTFKVEVETDLNLHLQPGAVVIVQADGLDQEEPTNVLQTTFAHVEEDNRLSITMANKSTRQSNLKKANPIAGLTIQALAAFHTPIQIEKEDLVIMANIDKTVKSAEANDPTFKEKIQKVAAAQAIMPDKVTNEQFTTDTALFGFMKETYKEACSALRKTGKPLPGRTHKPVTPCPKDIADNLLSQMDQSGLDPAWKKAYQEIVIENYDVFSLNRYDLGHATHYEHVIEPTQEGMQPPFTKQYTIPYADEALLDEIARELTQRKVLIPEFSPANSPVFIVRKPGCQPRFVEDLRRVNEASKSDRYQIRDIKESLNQAGRRRPKFFSSLDLSGSFWQLSLAEESRPWSAFTLPFLATQFIWTRTPMGAKGSTASFAKFLHIVFQDCKEVITYVDDLLTMAQTHEEMLRNLDKIFAILRLHNLKLNLRKCKFGLQEIDWLGFTIDANGLKPELSKVNKCKQLQPPESVKEIQSQLPFMAFNSQCLEDFQGVAGPLTDLTKDNSPWKSTKKDGPLPPKAMAAWKKLKAMLIERPTIYWPNTSLPFQMFCDASVGTEEEPGGISAVLTQVINGVTRPIGYYSRRLRSSENRYNSFNAEMASINAALNHWRPLLIGADITIFTDHRPILNHAKRPVKTMNSLVHKILQFAGNIKITHLIGKNNHIADYLSRNALDDQEETSTTSASKTNQNQAKTSISLKPEKIKTKKQKQTGRVNQNINKQSAQQESAELSEDDTASSTSADNVNKQTDTYNVKTSQNISNSMNQGTNTISDITRTALIAKEHKRLGLVGSKARLTAQGIASAGTFDLTSQKLWQTSQQEDPVTKALIDYCVYKRRPTEDTAQSKYLNKLITNICHKITVEDGILYYFGTYRKSPLTKKLYVPQNLVTPIIADAHQAATSGHWAAETTIANLMQTMFWMSMAADVQDYIRKCEICYTLKDPKATASKAPIQPHKTPPRPNYRIHVDLVGPLHSITEHKYVMTLVDALTRWTVLVPLKSKEAVEVAEAIVNNWILKIGAIEYLVSDNGREFVNDIVANIAKYMEITLHTTAAYSPKSNGKAERIHRELGRFLTIYTDSIGMDWITFLPALEHSLNTKCHTSTGCSPWFLHYGRYPIFPWRNQFGITKNYGQDEATQRMQLIRYALDMVKTKDEEAKAAFSKAYNKKCRERTFQVGDAVLLHYEASTLKGRVNRKFTKRWHGIYYIDQVLGKNTFIVKKHGGRRTKVSADRLRIYNEYLHLDDPEVKLTPGDNEAQEDEDVNKEDAPE